MTSSQRCHECAAIRHLPFRLCRNHPRGYLKEIVLFLCVQSLPAVYKIEMRHGEFTWLVKRKEKHFIDLHKELRTYKTFMKLPLPTRR